jgi:hypothetical protein
MSAQDQQARFINAPWTNAIPDDCTCGWHNYSDSSGWFRKTTDPDCPIHGECPLCYGSKWMPGVVRETGPLDEYPCPECQR